MVQSQSRQPAPEQWQHRQLLLGVEAFDAGWLTGEQFAAAMGRTLAGAGSEEALWLAPGLLSMEQLRVVSRRVERRLERSASASVADPLLDALDAASDGIGLDAQAHDVDRPDGEGADSGEHEDPGEEARAHTARRRTARRRAERLRGLRSCSASEGWTALRVRRSACFTRSSWLRESSRSTGRPATSFM
jgi:hypothetical protein